MSEPLRPHEAKRDAAAPSPRHPARRHLVLWDGDCAFCGRCVEWSRARDTQGRLDFARYQEVDGPPMTPALKAACARAVHVVTSDGRTLRGGRAVLFVLEELGWRTTGRVLALPPFVWLVELAYWIVARNRHFFGRFLFR